MKKPSPQKVQKILDALRKLYPDAHCELEHRNPFELLIATILSAQCTDKRVNQTTPKLFSQANNPQAFLELGYERLLNIIRPCGLSPSKAKNILSTCQILLEKHDGKVPSDFDALLRLAGVGRKTANVVISNAFGVAAIAVDTHVFRVSQRLGLAEGKTPDQIEAQLCRNLDSKDWTETHHLLIFHGRRLCLARSPHCEECPLQTDCLWFKSHARV